MPHGSAALRASGLQHDREWMLVDGRRSPAQFVTQRDAPLLATVSATVTGGESAAVSLHLAAPGHVPLVVGPGAASAARRVRVWRHETVAHDCGDAAAQWFARVLGWPEASLRLVRFDASQRRDCDRHYAGDSGAHTLFADGYPVLIASEQSLTALNERIVTGGGTAIAMNRFRPNVVLTGLPAWDEDHLETIDMGEVRLRLVKPCVRCEVTTTDQATGSRLGEEPLHTLARFRNHADLGGVTFGWNAVVERAGALHSGSAVGLRYRF